MSHVKAGGSTRLGRDSQAKRLGVKKFGNEKVIAGNIIIRQRGTKYRCGLNTKIGNDHTIYATTSGQVKFRRVSKVRFDSTGLETVYVDVVA